MTPATLHQLIAHGEFETLEFKRSTAELRRAGTGTFPTGVNAESLSDDHLSVRRNPLISGAFHLTGAVEIWGRGTNRVIESCKAAGIAAPEFTELSGSVVVTFRVAVAPDIAVAGTGAGPSRHQVGTKSALSRHQVQVLEIAKDPRTLQELMAPSGRTDRTKFRDQVVGPLLDSGLLEMTIPEKPRSSKQKYRTTTAGREFLLHEGMK